MEERSSFFRRCPSGMVSERWASPKAGRGTLCEWAQIMVRDDIYFMRDGSQESRRRCWRGGAGGQVISSSPSIDEVELVIKREKNR